MANFSDAKAGWEIFQESDYTLTHDELNRRLTHQAYAPISARTYTHYQKLVRYGFEHYLPINQLDVKTLQNPVWDAATRNRYTTIDAQVAVRLRVLGDGAVVELTGHATKLSESVVVLHLAPSKQNSILSEKSVGMPAQLVFVETGELVLATLDSISMKRQPRRISLRLGVLRPLPTPQLLGRERFQPSTLRLRLASSNGDYLLTQTVQELYWFYQSIESAGVITSEILVAFDQEDRYAVPPTQLVSLRLHSPLEAIVIATLTAGYILEKVVGRLLEHRKTFWEGSVAMQTAKQLEWENEKRRVRDELEVEDIISDGARRIASSLGAPAPDAPLFDQDKVSGIAKRQLVPSAQELTEVADAIAIEVTDND